MSRNDQNIQRASACVIIPVYQGFSGLNAYEVISITRCFSILHNYPVFFIGPASNNWLGYRQFCSGNHFSFYKKDFSDHFFEGLDGYNRLMMSTDFYSSFSEFEFMLVCQTDCFVFRDELAEWCAQGYDYIGAPWVGVDMSEWFKTPWYPRELVYLYRLFKNSFIHMSGNGGFSLRRISSIISNLHRFHTAAKRWQAQEDNFYSHYVGTFNPFFRMPAMKTALRFSFDTYPEKAYRLNHHMLPFACHAWFKHEAPHYEHNLPFWEPLVQAHIA